MRFFDHLCFYTDDREAGDILNNRHMNDVVRSAIRCGVDPVTAIKSATYNTAREIKIEDLGVIAPGFVADVLLVEGLEELKPSHVFYNGELVAENGKLLTDIEDESYAIRHRNSMYVKELSIGGLRIQALVENGAVRVSLMEYKDLSLSNTLVGCEGLSMENGYPKLNDDDLKFVAIASRRKGHDTVVLSVMRGFGTTIGALASTISHDSHNLTTVYDTAENALFAANELIACGGDICVIKGEAVLHTLQLPLARLISLKPAEELAVDNTLVKDANHTLGLVDMKNPLLKIVTLALPVIPEAKVSDLGLIDILKKEVVPLFV